MLAVMVAAGKVDFSELTRADFEAWEQHGARAPRIPTAGVMMALRVLAAMGVLQPAATGLFGGHVGERVTWGPYSSIHRRHVSTLHCRLENHKTTDHASDLHALSATLR